MRCWDRRPSLRATDVVARSTRSHPEVVRRPAAPQAVREDAADRGVGGRGPLSDPAERPRVLVRPEGQLEAVVRVRHEHVVDAAGEVVHGAGRAVVVLGDGEQRGVGVGPFPGQEDLEHVVAVGVLAGPVVVKGARGQTGVASQVVDAEVAEGLAQRPLGGQVQAGGQQLGPGGLGVPACAPVAAPSPPVGRATSSGVVASAPLTPREYLGPAR